MSALVTEHFALQSLSSATISESGSRAALYLSATGAAGSRRKTSASMEVPCESPGTRPDCVQEESCAHARGNRRASLALGTRTVGGRAGQQRFWLGLKANYRMEFDGVVRDAGLAVVDTSLG
jgi:hypothetical protein